MKSKTYLVLFFLAALTLYTYLLRFKAVAAPQAPALEGIPLSIDGFDGSGEYLEPRSLRVLGADQTIYRLYRESAGRKMWLFVGYFSAAQENSQIHSPKHCYPGSGWDIYNEGSVELVLDHAGLAVKRLFISNGPSRRVVFYWFTTGSGIITNEFSLKFDQMRSALLRKPQSAAFVRFSAEVGSGEEEERALDELVLLAKAISPHIESVLRGPLGGLSGAGEKPSGGREG